MVVRPCQGEGGREEGAQWTQRVLQAYKCIHKHAQAY
jgi:hypothetical protein